MDTSTLLSRLQFAFTISFHYLFPQLTMGLALLILILKTLYLWRKDERYNIGARFWARIFAITFIMGVVTGIPMEFQFGTNWARFSVYAGDIIAQTLAMEGAFAFFIESAFLGILLFGEQVFGQKMHWFSAFLVWLGTWTSGGFIIASKSWMHHPAGYTIVANGRLHLSKYLEKLVNTWVVPQYLHTMIVGVQVLIFLTYRRWTGVVKGLNAYRPDQQPDSIALLYYSYHIMVGLGTFFIAIMALAVLLLWRRRLFQTRGMLWILLLALPFPFIANTAGWFTAELGRQPWIVYGLLQTVRGSSANLSDGNVLFTLIGFAGMYLLLGLLYVVLIVHEALHGPEPAVEETATNERQLASSTHEQQQDQPAHEEPPSKKHQDSKPVKQAKKGPSIVPTAIAVIAGTILTFGVEFLRLRRRK